MNLSKYKKIWVTSDLHLGHHNIIKFADRPFKSVEEMNKQIISNFNSLVGKEDLTIFVGDVIFKYEGDYSELINKFNGDKILIKGNHDNVNRYNKKDFIYIGDNLMLDYKDIRYFLTHYPMTSFPNMYKNVIQLYGHTHKGSREFEFPKIPNSYCVNLEFWDFKPIALDYFKPKNFIDEIGLMYGIQ